MKSQTTAKPLTRDQVLSIIGDKRDGKYICPLCHERCLSTFDKDGVTYVKCWHSCDSKDIFKLIRQDLGLWRDGAPAPDDPRTPKPSDVPDYPGFTPADYSELKHLSLAGLTEWFGVTEVKLGNGKAATAIPYKDANGKVLAMKIRKSYDSHDTYFKPKDPKIPYGLWLNTNRVDADGKWPQDVVICEGESDTQTLFAHNIAALGISGSNGWRPEYAELDVLKNAERIFIVQESDDAGPKFVESVAKSFEGREVFVIKFTESAKDASALYLEGPEWFDVAFNALSATRPEAHTSGHIVEFRMASTYKPRRVEWLWPYRIPAGEQTTFAGNCDVGKSTVMADIVARVTKGLDWPDGSKNTFGPAYVLMCVAEGSKEKDLIPLLMAAGADLDRVAFYTQMKPVDPTKAKMRRLTLLTDLDAVADLIKKFENMRLIVFDPLTGYLGVKKNDEVAIRSVLEPLGEFADKHGVAVVSIDHFNKNLDQAAVNRVSGSQALTDVPRAAWGFVKKADEKDGPKKNERSMVSLKGNLAAEDKKTGLDYKFTTAPITVEGELVNFRKVEWIGETTQTADAAIAGDRHVPDIDRWLKELLANGEMKARDVEEAGKEKNYTPKQIYGARERLGVTHRKANKAEFTDTPTLLKLPPQKPVPGQALEAEDAPYG